MSGSRFHKKYGDIGLAAANTLISFSLDIVDVIASYLACLSPDSSHHREVKVLSFNLLRQVKEEFCWDIAISFDDHLWRVCQNGVDRYDLDGHYTQLQNGLEHNDNFTNIAFTKDFIALKGLGGLELMRQVSERPIIFSGLQYVKGSLSQITATNSAVFTVDGHGHIWQISLTEKEGVIKRQHIRTISSGSAVFIACDSKENLWLANGSKTITVLPTQDSKQTAMVYDMPQPVRFFRFDRFDNIHIIDPTHNAIDIYNSSTLHFLTTIPIHAACIAFDRFNRIYVADRNGKVTVLGFVERDT